MRFLLCFLLFSSAFAQAQKKSGPVQPSVNYHLNVDTAQQLVNVEMRLRNVPDTFRLALFAHPEYDDRFWRYVKNIRIENGTVRREDSALWRIGKSGAEAVVRYTVQWPREEGQRAAWVPFLSATGGLIGGPHFYLYVVGAEQSAAHVQVALPQGWKAATALEATADSTVFYAPAVAALVDAPVLVGHFKKWAFSVNGVPHAVMYWPSAEAVAFNEAALVDGIKKIVEGTRDVFGSLPYREYYFLLQDDAYGSLEHANSVTLGAPSKGLANEMKEYFDEIAHEYFHAFNLVRIHPAAYDGKVRYTKPPLSKELWWSEGLTMFYTDALLRRAGLNDSADTRIKHLQNGMERYYNHAGNYTLSPETVSLSAYAPEGALGDYVASTHLQGELIGTLLDMLIRDATNGQKTMDDAMRLMSERFSGEKGFTTADVALAVNDVCGCDVRPFFAKHVRGSAALPFNDYLRRIGLRAAVRWEPAVDKAGKPMIDFKIYSWPHPVTGAVMLTVMDPQSVWGKSGLHTGNELLSVNGAPVKTPGDFFRPLRTKSVGDSVRLDVKQGGIVKKITVVMRGFQHPVVEIKEIESAVKAKRLLRDWMRAEK